jgi:transglutaminase-like putative cysteine protease
MTARVRVDQEEPIADMSPGREGIGHELASILSLAPESPHHFLGSSPRVRPEPAITAYAGKGFHAGETVLAGIEDLCCRIKAEFAYDTEATTVDTPAADAFTRKRGVCQDFAHIMIAGLRGLGIPAGYVSGFLRTSPPPGRERLEGADAMHAWVRAWCGKTMGWREFDPTNAVPVGIDHIVVARGRDYDDAAPIVGVLMTYGSQKAEQSVDVVPVE